MATAVLGGSPALVLALKRSMGRQPGQLSSWPWQECEGGRSAGKMSRPSAELPALPPQRPGRGQTKEHGLHISLQRELCSSLC